MTHLSLSLLFLGLYIIINPQVSAQQCSIHFNYGVITHPKHIRIVDQGQTKIQINEAKQLFIQGREVELSVIQQKVLAQFYNGLRKQLPAIVSIALEGVDIGLKTISDVIGSLTGENSASQQKVQAKFDELKWRTRTRFNQSADNYYIAPQDFTDLDGLLAGQFEQEMEEIISTSIGTIMTAVERSILTDNTDEEYKLEERVVAFDHRLTHLSKELDFEVSERTKALNKKASLFCEKLHELNKIEGQLQAIIIELKDYDLIKKTH